MDGRRHTVTISSSLVQGFWGDVARNGEVRARGLRKLSGRRRRLGVRGSGDHSGCRCVSARSGERVALPKSTPGISIMGAAARGARVKAIRRRRATAIEAVQARTLLSWEHAWLRISRSTCARPTHCSSFARYTTERDRITMRNKAKRATPLFPQVIYYILKRPHCKQIVK